MWRDSESGAVLLDAKICIGCRMCAIACPFGAIGLNYLDEPVSILKCDLCDGDPQCVRFCEPGALQFMRREQLGAQRRDSAARLLFIAEKRACTGAGGGTG
jgi:Fe-S-cluster-containing hydrogenase component 2